MQSSSAVIFKFKKIKSVIASTFSPSICHEVMSWYAMNLVFWMLSFKAAISLSSYTIIKRLFSSSSLSAIRVVSSAYLRLLIFLLAVLIPACDSSRLTFFFFNFLHGSLFCCGEDSCITQWSYEPCHARPRKMYYCGKIVTCKKACKFLTKLNIVLPYDPSIISQGIYPTSLKTMSKQKPTCGYLYQLYS